MIIEMSVQVRLPGVERLLHTLGDELDGAVVEAAKAVQAQAQVNAPVDTGALRSSIYTVTAKGSGIGRSAAAASALRPGVGWVDVPWTVKRHEAVVAVGVSYGYWVENGAAGRAGRFYMASAAAQHRPTFERLVAAAVRRAT